MCIRDSFTHLPPDCKIQIFTLAGELVNTLYHNTREDDGSYEWDMLTKDNLDIAYGVYFYHVEPMNSGAYDFKPHLGKFAVIKFGTPIRLILARTVARDENMSFSFYVLCSHVYTNPLKNFLSSSID